MMLSRDTTVDRALAAVIVFAALVLEVIVLYATNIAAKLEFTAAVRSARLQREVGSGEATPYITVAYRRVYKYSWGWLPVALLWAYWILRGRHCSLLALLCYVGVSLNLAAVWLLFTLLALYVGNQLFYT